MDFGVGFYAGDVPVLVLGVDDGRDDGAVARLLEQVRGPLTVMVDEADLPADRSWLDVDPIGRDPPGDRFLMEEAPEPRDQLLAWLMGVDLSGAPLETVELPDVVRDTLLREADDPTEWLDSHRDKLEGVGEAEDAVGRANAQAVARICMAAVVPPDRVTWQYLMDAAVAYETVLHVLLALRTAPHPVLVATETSAAQLVARVLLSLRADRLVPPPPADGAVHLPNHDLDGARDMLRWLRVLSGPLSGSSGAEQGPAPPRPAPVVWGPRTALQHALRPLRRPRPAQFSSGQTPGQPAAPTRRAAPLPPASAAQSAQSVQLRMQRLALPEQLATMELDPADLW